MTTESARGLILAMLAACRGRLVLHDPAVTKAAKPASTLVLVDEWRAALDQLVDAGEVSVLRGRSGRVVVQRLTAGGKACQTRGARE